MAEDTLVKDALSDAMIKAGAELTQKLDEAKWPVVASFWLYVPESNVWKLVVASPIVGTAGPRQAYEAIQMAIGTLSKAAATLALTDVEVVEPSHYLVGVLRHAVNTGPTINGIRFTRNVVNGHFIHDAYIYRVSDRAPGGRTT